MALDDIIENSEKRIVIKLHDSAGNYISFYKGYHIKEWIDAPGKVLFFARIPSFNRLGLELKRLP